MASGRTHETINLVVLGSLAAAYAFGLAQGLNAELEALAPPRTRLTFAVAYLAGTFLVTPDLDLAERRVRAKNNWGLLGLLWVPYGALFKHRGWSHSWFVGPLTRLLYLVVLVLALAYLVTLVGSLLGLSLRLEAPLVAGWREPALGALAGYYLSQWLHLIADGIWPDHGPRRMGGKRRRR